MGGLECSGGLAFVKPGYWAYLSDTVQTTDGTRLYQTAACPAGFCPGAPLQARVDTDFGNTTTSDTQAMKSLCAFPRVNSASNLFCASCVEGYLPWGDACVPCTRFNGALFFGGLVLSFMIVGFLLHSSGSSSAGLIMVLLYFVQTASLEMGPVAKFLSWLQISLLSTDSSSACLAPLSPYGQTLFSLMMPVILIAELAVIACVHRALRKYAGPLASEDAPGADASWWKLLLAAGSRAIRTFSPDRYIAGAMSVLLFCYTQVAVTSIKYLYCVDVGPSRVLFASPTVDCRSAEYRAYLVPVFLAIIVYVIGFPLAILIKLGRSKADILYAASAAYSSKQDSFRPRWNPLYGMYHARAWFWQPLVLLRRSAFVLVSVWLVQQPSIKFMSYALLNFASLLAHQLARPFELRELNRAETMSYALLVSLSMLLTGYLPPYSLSIQVALFLLVVPATGVAGCFVIRQQWSGLWGALNSATPDPASHQAELTETQLELVTNPALSLRCAAVVPLGGPHDDSALSDQPLTMLPSDSSHSDGAQL